MNIIDNEKADLQELKDYTTTVKILSKLFINKNSQIIFAFLYRIILKLDYYQHFSKSLLNYDT